MTLRVTGIYSFLKAISCLSTPAGKETARPMRLAFRSDSTDSPRKYAHPARLGLISPTPAAFKKHSWYLFLSDAPRQMKIARTVKNRKPANLQNRKKAAGVAWRVLKLPSWGATGEGFFLLLRAYANEVHLQFIETSSTAKLDWLAKLYCLQQCASLQVFKLCCAPTTMGYYVCDDYFPKMAFEIPPVMASRISQENATCS